ncbi:S-layer homology domain-containing protein, partial [Niameybacter massiliensis]
DDLSHVEEESLLNSDENTTIGQEIGLGDSLSEDSTSGSDDPNVEDDLPHVETSPMNKGRLPNVDGNTMIWQEISSGDSLSEDFTSGSNDSNVAPEDLNWDGTYADENNSGGGTSTDSSSSDNTIITVTPHPTENGNNPVVDTIIRITDKNIKDSYNEALVESKRSNKKVNGITLVLNKNTGNKILNSVTVNLPQSVQDFIISKKNIYAIEVAYNPNIKIKMDLATIKEINKQAKADVNVTITKLDSNKLAGNAKTAIGSRPVFELKVNYGSGKQVSNFGTGNVMLEIPYTLGSNEKAGNVHAVYVDTNGKIEWLTNSVYDCVSKVLRFTTSHFSTYGVGYKTINTNFTDITNHWAKENIEFIVARGLFNGTTTTTFMPKTAMKRGMFVTALGRLAKVDVSKYTKSRFYDVKDDAYYMGYVEWATENKIINGIGDCKFAPEQPITREQMTVIIKNYAKAIGFNLPKSYKAFTFVDNVKINPYAKDAVKQMQMAGVISGKNGDKFFPQGIATRAEVATVLKRFVELMIDRDFTQD